MSANLDRAATFLRDLADIAGRILQDELAMTPARAGEVGARIARATCDEHRGENIYVPTSRDLDIQERDEDLYAAWRRAGKDVRPVAKEFNLTEKQVYERVRLYEAAAFDRTQGKLDLDAPA